MFVRMNHEMFHGNDVSMYTGNYNEANSLEACAVVSSMRTQRNTYIQQRAYRCSSIYASRF